MSDNLINLTDIPANWQLTKISEIADVIMGQSPPSSTYNNEKIGLPFFQGKAEFTDLHPIIKKWCSEPNKISLPGDILISVRAPVGTVNIANAECCIGRGLSAIRYPECNKFLFYYFRLVERKLDEKGTGSTFRAISGDVIKNVSLFLPPLLEQHRIVVKIEALFSELDKGIESFITAREQLKIYRQALLKHAFSGKLTAQWREENQDKLETAEALLQRIQTKREQGYQQQLKDWEATGKQGGKPKAPKVLPPIMAEELAELPELPKGWAWVRMIEACEAVVDCHNKTAPYQASGVPLVRTPSIRDMKLNFDDSIRYVSRETYEFWSKRCLPQPGDILFTREAPMGEAAIIPAGKLICMGQRIMLLRPGNVFLSAKYLLCATQNPFFKEAAALVAVGTGVKHLRVGDVERLTFPICSINEQLEIANQLDAQLPEADQLDQTLTTALQQAEALRQSILKKAFSGQLVQQDLSDEPASVLLERIQAEKATLVTPIRKRNKYA